MWHHLLIAVSRCTYLREVYRFCFPPSARTHTPPSPRPRNELVCFELAWIWLLDATHLLTQGAFLNHSEIVVFCSKRDEQRGSFWQTVVPHCKVIKLTYDQENVFDLPCAPYCTPLQLKLVHLKDLKLIMLCIWRWNNNFSRKFVVSLPGLLVFHINIETGIVQEVLL